LLLDQFIAQNNTGLFLVRLSSNNDSCFTISRINKDNKIVHQRIARDKRGNYVVQVGEELKAFKSLIELIEKGERDLNLKVLLRDSVSISFGRRREPVRPHPICC
jgi:hypothetical protein